ncbi:MAG: phosphatase PAP2 family protein [Desulfovibrio sp.]|jgi:acid phosphatase (class A)|nr:phosphatase PAP2 family protein [Desulfovibrio sp.]
MKKLLLLLCLLCFAVLPAHAAGFIAPGDEPDSLVFLPPPPAPDSAEFLRDQAVYLQTRSLKGTERWSQAAFDADIENNRQDFFKDALGFSIDKQRTPALYALLSRVRADFGAAARSAKDRYRRVRPFMYFGQEGATCAPVFEEELKTNGSYPSGHTTLGWGMALILSEVLPARKDDILKRGYEYGMSRVVCGVHWQSDVDAGFLVGSAVAAQLHNSREFQELLRNAQAEVAALQNAPKPQ